MMAYVTDRGTPAGPDIADIVRQLAPAALIHVDATQAVGRIHIDLAEELAEIDLLSLSPTNSTARKV